MMHHELPQGTVVPQGTALSASKDFLVFLVNRIRAFEYFIVHST